MGSDVPRTLDSGELVRQTKSEITFVLTSLKSSFLHLKLLFANKLMKPAKFEGPLLRDSLYTPIVLLHK